METMNQGAQTSEGIAFVMTQAMKQQLRDLGFTPEQIREMPPAIGHHIINDFPKLRDRCKGLSKERMAQFTKAYLEDVLEDPPTDAISAFEEEDAQPEASPDPQAQTIHTTDKPLPRDAEMQAAIDAGMQVMSDPGNEPKRTRDAPRRMHPREGRPAIDINDPNVKRVLERYRPLSLQEIAQQKPPQWLLARHIPENSLVELFGEFATCKSFLALAWALSIAAGKPWLGQKTQQGHVVYVYAEGTQGLRKRGLAWCKENGLDDFPEKFHAIPRPIDMRDPNALDHVALAIKLALPKTKPSLIVIDTLNRCFGGGDENSTQDMTGFINGCDALREEFGATVLVVHHSGKDRVKGSRGASALGGAMDVIFELVKARRDQPLAILRNNTNTTKPHKDSAPLPPLALDFVEIELDLEPDADDPHANTSLVVRSSNTEAAVATAAAEQATKRKTVAEETLDIIRTYKNGITRTELMKVTGKARQTINSRLDTLLDAGLIREEGERFITVDEDEAS